jgi:hypothetical protein
MSTRDKAVTMHTESGGDRQLDTGRLREYSGPTLDTAAAKGSPHLGQCVAVGQFGNVS